MRYLLHLNGASVAGASGGESPAVCLCAEHHGRPPGKCLRCYIGPYPEARRYRRISPVQIGERNWNPEALADGEELYSNVLSQDFAHLRTGSRPEGLNPFLSLTEGPVADIWVSFRGSPNIRIPSRQSSSELLNLIVALLRGLGAVQQDAVCTK